jgi:DNA-directed RNA polymerase subunit RPC12/RpoP
MNDTNAERHLAAGLKLYKCKTCARNLGRSHFWPDDMCHASRGIACKECMPTPPEERQALRTGTLTCKTCERELPKDRFWPSDLPRGSEGIQCKSCWTGCIQHDGRFQSRTGDDIGDMIEANEKVYKCKTCARSLGRSQFWPRDLKNAYRGIACKECCPTPPEERRAKPPETHSCKTCGRELPKAEFWRSDLPKSTHGIECKECQPTAPKDRTKRKQAAEKPPA